MFPNQALKVLPLAALLFLYKQVLGVEPELASEAAESFATGELRLRESGPTIADRCR